MSHTFQAVGWNPFKVRYDRVLAVAIVGWIAAFVGASLALFPEATLEILLIRATGVAAFALLHVVLCIGPLARLRPGLFLPLLYNRRHLGVATFLVGLVHASLVVLTYHAGADVNPLVGIFVSDTGPGTAGFPFQALGFAALGILFLMAATSHDFWLAALSAPVWKALHMSVYAAYALLVGHVALGVLQAEAHPLFAAATAVGAATVLALHLVAGAREAAADRPREAPADAEGWIDLGRADAIPEGRGRSFLVGGERVAVFRHGGGLSAVSGVCRHQNGPLGEGRVIDGCITCPWHGYQYRPETGAAPPPFTESVPTFRIRVCAGRVRIHPRPNPPGTRVEPARPEEDPGS